jgi:hypothetical protein
MKVLYIEGVATHSGPESCVAGREGGGEALTGESAGRAIEPRNHGNRGADAVSMSGRQHRCQRYGELTADLARSKNRGMHGSSMRENREVSRPPAQLGEADPDRRRRPARHHH